MIEEAKSITDIVLSEAGSIFIIILACSILIFDRVKLVKKNDLLQAELVKRTEDTIKVTTLATVHIEEANRRKEVDSAKIDQILQRIS